LATACVTATAGLAATGASAATVATVSFGGREPTAVFESVDGCLERSAFVFVDDGIWREHDPRHTQGPNALVSLAETNTCTGNGKLIFGHADLAPDDVTVRGDLGAASLHATALVRPFPGASAAEVRFDLEWEGAGTLVRRNWTAKSVWDDNIDIGHELTWYRPAVASGSISDGHVDYTGGAPSAVGAIWLRKIGDIEIAR
jgi:hypothetical protein